MITTLYNRGVEDGTNASLYKYLDNDNKEYENGYNKGFENFCSKNINTMKPNIISINKLIIYVYSYIINIPDNELLNYIDELIIVKNIKNFEKIIECNIRLKTDPKDTTFLYLFLLDSLIERYNIKFYKEYLN